MEHRECIGLWVKSKINRIDLLCQMWQIDCKGQPVRSKRAGVHRWRSSSLKVCDSGHGQEHGRAATRAWQQLNNHKTVSGRDRFLEAHVMLFYGAGTSRPRHNLNEFKSIDFILIVPLEYLEKLFINISTESYLLASIAVSRLYIWSTCRDKVGRFCC